MFAPSQGRGGCLETSHSPPFPSIQQGRGAGISEKTENLVGFFLHAIGPGQIHQLPPRRACACPEAGIRILDLRKWATGRKRISDLPQSQRSWVNTTGRATVREQPFAPRPPGSCETVSEKRRTRDGQPCRRTLRGGGPATDAPCAGERRGATGSSGPAQARCVRQRRGTGSPFTWRGVAEKI